MAYYSVRWAAFPGFGGGGLSAWPKPPAVDDADRLMAGVRERDETAFERLYDRYHRFVYAIAARMLTEPAAAEDLTQSVFLKIWSSPQSYAGGNFGAWLARVTRNRALDILRLKSSRTEELPLDLAVEGELEEQVFANVDGERVRSALSQLPEDQRLPIELGFFAGITHEEIARRTATPLGTVKTRIRTGLRKMRTVLESSVTL